MDKDRVKTKIKELIQKYDAVKNSGKISSYNEEETKNAFIKPLFEALGWNFSEKEEVSAEENIISSGRVDYGFYIIGRIKFYLEAKPLKADLNNEDYARQAIRYSFNKGVTWAILTDFESIKVFNAQSPSNYLGDKKYFELKYSEYLPRFDKLWELSKESFTEDLIDKKAEEVGKKLQRIPITELLYKDLNECRELLTNSLGQYNREKVTKDGLDEGVQKLLDRLIFIRVAEDRKIEENTLVPLINQWRSSTSINKPELYESMVHKFRELDVIYNSNLFSEHPFEKWEDDGAALEKVIKILHGKQGYYEYDFSIMSADVLGSVYENYLCYKLSQSKKKLTVNKDAKKRKEQGIYYTPNFIVDYIVRNTLKPVLDKCTSINDLKKIKILDPACGSGSFLIKAMDVIAEKYKEFKRSTDEFTKIQIIIENLYGVDLDEQAVEITRLNLLINTLQDKGKLPQLDKNIKNGNSLISGTDEELEKYFGKNFKDKKPFNWQKEFPEVFKQGGFDVIIGNPPYINSRNLESLDKDFFESSFLTAREQYDLYTLFIERSLVILNKNGRLGFIVPNKFLVTKYGQITRDFISKRAILEQKMDLSKENVFHDASVYPIIIILQKTNIELSINNDFNFKPKSALTKKIDSRANYVPLKVWRPLATTKDISDGDKIIITNKEIQRYYLKINRNGLLKTARSLDSAKNKIIMKKLCFNLEASIDEIGHQTVNTTYCIQSQDIDIDIKYILGILNSKLMTYYAREQYLDTALRGGYIELRVYQVQTLPIIRAEITDSQLIVKLVGQILKLNQYLEKTEENSNKWNSLKSEIEKTDKKIDEEVYKLYGLTQEEIKIIEGNNE